MKCHYIYTEDGLKVLVPGCMSVAVSGDIADCTCREETFEAFERERYNKTVKALRKQVKELERENIQQNRIIKNLLKKLRKTMNKVEHPKTKMPKVVSEGKIKIGDFEIRVCVLDDGKRIIPQEDFKKALDFLGLTEDDVEKMKKGNTHEQG